MSGRQSSLKRQQHQRGGWLLPPLAVGLTLIFREVFVSLRGFPAPCQPPLWYPLLILTHDPSIQTALCIGILVAVILLLRRAQLCYVKPETALLMGLICGAILFATGMEGAPETRLVLSDTYRIDETVYRLTYAIGEGVGVDETYPIRVFVLFRCTGIGGMLCETVGTADMTVGRPHSLDASQVDQARLYIDVTHDELMLQVGNDIGWENLRSFIGCVLR